MLAAATNLRQQARWWLGGAAGAPYVGTAGAPPIGEVGDGGRTGPVAGGSRNVGD